jgi:hypothetical protein
MHTNDHDIQLPWLAMGYWFNKQISLNHFPFIFCPNYQHPFVRIWPMWLIWMIPMCESRLVNMQPCSNESCNGNGELNNCTMLIYVKICHHLWRWILNQGLEVWTWGLCLFVVNNTYHIGCDNWVCHFLCEKRFYLLRF